MGCICFFNTAIAWGGGEKWHLETASFLHRNGHKVLVVAHKKSVLLLKLKQTDIPCISVKISNPSFLNPLKHLGLKRELRRYPIETIVMNLSRDVKIAGVCAKALGIERIVYRRGSAIPIKNTFLNRYYFKNIVTEVLANSKATKRTVLQNNPSLFPKEKIKVIYNGIDLSRKPEEKSESRTKEITFTLVNLGRLEAQKNQESLIYLAEESKERMDTIIRSLASFINRNFEKIGSNLINLDEQERYDYFINKVAEFEKKIGQEPLEDQLRQKIVRG